MRVMCINDLGWVASIPKPITTSYFFGLVKITRHKKYVGPSYGDVCTVVGDITDEEGHEFYCLAEWPDNRYSKGRFIPLGEIEAVEEYEQIENIGIKT